MLHDCKVKIIMIVTGFVREELCPYSICNNIYKDNG